MSWPRVARRGIAISLLAILVVIVQVALAASPHYKPRSPRFVDNGVTLTALGAVAGLGNADLKIDLVATGFATTFCQAPGGGNEAPGQNPALQVTGSGSLLVPAEQIKNGNLEFSVTTQPPPTPTWDQAGCANPNWGVRVGDVVFTNWTLSWEQPIGTPLPALTESCTHPGTSDGPVSGATCN